MDTGIRAISEKHNFKIFIVDLTKTLQTISEMQKTNPLATIVLSKVTLANTLLGLDLKNGEAMSSHIKTEDGLIGKIIAEFQDDKIRSYIQNPDFDAQSILQQENQNPYTLALGKKGTLTVTRQLAGYEPYISRVDLVDGGIDSDFMEYSKVSNQLKTLIATRVELNQDFTIQSAVGFSVQLFPQHKDEDITYLDQKIVNSQVICQKIAALKSKNYTDLIYQIASDAIIVGEPNILKFECSCNHQKTLFAIQMLGREEIGKMIGENKPVVVICDFCKKEYLISVSELESLINQK